MTPSPTFFFPLSARMVKPLEIHTAGKVVLSDLHGGSNIPNGNSLLCE